jgi:sugar fermentation stimulation protein A
MSNTVLYRYSKLIPAKLIRRYKRFLADIVLNESETTIHCPNTGPMIGLGMDKEPPILISYHESKTRKHAHTLEAIKLEGGFVGCHSVLSNKLVESALRQGRLDEALGGPFSSIQPEVKHGASRFDFLLSKADKRSMFVEVKCVTLAEGLAEDRVALFPDTVSDRALKHTTGLTEIAKGSVNQQQQAAIVFVLLRNDCNRLASSWQYDPKYAAQLKESVDAGVKVVAMVCDLSKPDGSPLGSEGEYVWSFVKLMEVELEYKREEYEGRQGDGGGGKKKRKM